MEIRKVDASLGSAYVEVLISLSLILFVAIGLQDFFIAMRLHSLKANQALILSSIVQSSNDYEKTIGRVIESQTVTVIDSNFLIIPSDEGYRFFQNDALSLEFRFSNEK